MHRYLFFVFLSIFFAVGCKTHQHTKATAEKDRPVLKLNHCDYSPACFNALSLLYQWPADDLNTPYGANLRVNAVRAVLSGIIMDNLQVKKDRLNAIAMALNTSVDVPKLLNWAAQETYKIQSIPEAKKDAISLSRVVKWMGKNGCTNTMKALKNWQTLSKDIRPLALLYAVSAGFNLLTFYPEANQWLDLRRFRRRLHCVNPKSSNLSELLFGLYKPLVVAVRSGLNDPDPALASASLQVSNFLSNKGMAFPFNVAGKGVVLGVDIPKSIRPGGIARHPDYLIVVTKGRLRVVQRPRIMGLNDVSKLPEPKVLLDIDLPARPDRTLVPVVQKVLMPLVKTWEIKQRNYLPILCDRSVSAHDLMLATSLVVGVTKGYPLLAVYDQDRKVPVFIPLNTISAQRGFILPNGKFNIYDPKMQPVVMGLNPGLLKIQTQIGKAPKVFNFPMDKLPDLRQAYKAVSALTAKGRYLEIRVAPKVPVWSLIAIMQTMFYRVSSKDLISVPAFLGAGLTNGGGPGLKPLFDDCLVLPEKK